MATGSSNVRELLKFANLQMAAEEIGVRIQFP